MKSKFRSSKYILNFRFWVIGSDEDKRSQETIFIQLPDEITEQILQTTIFSKNKENESEWAHMGRYRNLKLVCHKFNDILNHPDFPPRPINKRRH